MRWAHLLVLSLLVPVSAAFAEEIVMSVEQTDYYFIIGEKAVIPVKIQNDRGQPVQGMLQYTITQNIMQANAQVSSSNSQVSPLTVAGGLHTIELDFGTSNAPSETVLDLSFIYSNGTQINVSLDPIRVHFVADQSQKNNESNSMQSTSQVQQSGQGSPPDAQQSIQQRLDEMLNQQQDPQDPQQKLQNNQLAQDSSALKREIQEQLQKESDLKRAFEDELASNEDFQRPHQELLDQGYSVTDRKTSPETERTGDFEVDYQNEQGEGAKVQGSMVNGTITEIQQQTEKGTEELMEQMRSHPDFLRYDEELKRDGFSEQDTELTYDSNSTTARVQYNNTDNQTASIYGKFESDTLEDVRLERPAELAWLILLPIIAITSYLIYRLLNRGRTAPPAPAPAIQQVQYRSEMTAERLIKEGKKDYEDGNYKDAYGKINQAVRMFLGRELDLEREVTNEGILKRIPKGSWPVTDIEECFRIASMVEFAKYAPNEEDFGRIVSIAEDLILDGSGMRFGRDTDRR